MTANEWDHQETPEAPLYGDQEAEAASGVPLPSLRVLQSAGAMRSAKTPKTHGGFRRMWTDTDVLKAAVAAALGEHFAWNIRLTAEAGGGQIVLRVRDSGRGIDPDLLPRVFDLFQRGLDSGEQAGDGLGIGLALVKALVELHGGSVAAFSDGLTSSTASSGIQTFGRSDQP